MPPYKPESELIQFLDKLDQEGGNAQGDLDRRVTENIEQYRGKQWKGSEPPYFLFNISQSSIEDKVGKLSESRPKLNILANREGLEKPKDVLKHVIDSWWDNQKVEYQTERVALWGALAGAAFVGLPFNRNLHHGLGDIEFIIKDPRSCKVDPIVTQAEKVNLGEYQIVEDFLPTDFIKSSYPVRASDIQPDERVSGFAVQSPTKAGSLIRGAYSRLFGKKETQRISAIPRTIIKEYYVQDRRRSIEDSGQVPVVQHITKHAPEGIPFPGGRRILRVNDVVLEDSFNPYWDGMYPTNMLSWKMDPETVWGPDEMQSIKRMQEAINRLGSSFTQNALLNSVVRIVLDQGALSPKERNKLSNLAAEIIEKSPGREFNYQVPPPLPNYIPEFMGQLINLVREKIGVVQSPAQRELPSIVTGPVIEGLQMMVETPIRTSARRIEEFYQRLGQQLISRIFQFYTSDRVLRQVGPDNSWVEFEFFRHQLIVNPKTRAPRSEEDIRKAFQDFYFAIEPGSSLAVARMQRSLMKFHLVEMGWLHPREILEEAGILNPNEKLDEAQKARDGGLFAALEGRNGKQGTSLPNVGNLFQ